MIHRPWKKAVCIGRKSAEARLLEDGVVVYKTEVGQTTVRRYSLVNVLTCNKAASSNFTLRTVSQRSTPKEYMFQIALVGGKVLKTAAKEGLCLIDVKKLGRGSTKVHVGSRNNISMVKSCRQIARSNKANLTLEVGYGYRQVQILICKRAVLDVV